MQLDALACEKLTSAAPHRCRAPVPAHSALQPSAPRRPAPPCSVKDRVALEILQEALSDGRLMPGGLVTEGTVGSTGVSLAMCAGQLTAKEWVKRVERKRRVWQLGAAGSAAKSARAARLAHPAPLSFFCLAAYGCRAAIYMPDDAAIGVQ